MKQKIVSRWDSSKVLFECEIPSEVSSGLAMRHALERATKSSADLSSAYLRGADLRGANLRDAYLRGADLSSAYLSDADLRDAYLSGADLSSAYLSGADLSGADLRGADLRGADLSGVREVATDEQSIENLDKVRAIILDNKDRLNMGLWHGSEEWRNRTCAEETLCQTTHCLAGWLQVCSTDENVREEQNPQRAGIMAAPIAAKMFFRQAEEVFSWLDERKYVTEIAKHEERRKEREARKAVEQE